MSSPTRPARPRIVAPLTAFAVVGLAATALVAVSPGGTGAFTACAPAWSATSAYTKGTTASHNGGNYQAQWWTRNQDPSVDRSGVWAYKGRCGDAVKSPIGPLCSSASAWLAGHPYLAGDLVSYPDGKYYMATRNNPGYNPTVSIWYWRAYTCPPDFVVSADHFRQMFNAPNQFYSYLDLVTAMKSYPAFTKTGSDMVRKQEAAAFLANVSLETGALRYVVEQNTANYPRYCDASKPYGCPAGRGAYYGRGPLQLSWNFNYQIAGTALGIGLLHNPHLLEQNGVLAWKTAVWYWMTRTGIASMTPHDFMITSAGFGGTIRAINGGVECDGKGTSQVQSRVSLYKQFTAILGVPPGNNLYC